ncbi:hypothetical protein Pmani_010386 [Petrolisthes manimaculis]|uniref:Uncharacterized protein n=1 Tax=Petrolisthes manimaculis TaxID=1843537 RepID=A0AAE1Q362_9EUCA|nr:hypothetical protein Pmani_010386 [Petrolisthes manimaculis]
MLCWFRLKRSHSSSVCWRRCARVLSFFGSHAFTIWAHIFSMRFRSGAQSVPSSPRTNAEPPWLCNERNVSLD